MEWHTRLKSYRHRARLTQQQVAGKLRVSVSIVTKWEQGTHLPIIRNQNALAKLYNTTAEELGFHDGLRTTVMGEGRLLVEVFKNLDDGADS
jgi:transcriptional regulator with XRE-family HTH domain